jgi:putative endonuclease
MPENATWQSLWIGASTAMDRQGFVYILTNPVNTVLYTGVTSDLKGRVYEHKEKMVEGFTRRYNVTKLVYYEVSDSTVSAIAREKQIKAGSGRKKIQLIDTLNPKWRDLYQEL